MPAIDAPAPAQPHRGPAFGFTKHGHPVHARVFDHLPTGTPYARLNKHLALGAIEDLKRPVGPGGGTS